MRHPRVPLWSSVRQLFPAQRPEPRSEPYPEWLEPEFAARSGCRERWHGAQRRPVPRHPVRPRGYDSFSDPRWQLLFESCDLNGAATGTEVRHPFLDLRVLQFMLAVPPMPWCRNKLLIRTAMRTALPPEVIGRRKTSLASSPDFERVKASGLPHLVAAPDFARFLNPAKIPVAPRTPLELRSVLRAHGLNHWLHGLDDQQRSAPR
jgi:asparagine synthase (glutamine-hydrolysing)